MKNKEQHTKEEFLSEEILFQYKAGKLSPSEMRYVERLLEKYPLYAEALEGLELLEDKKALENIITLKQYAQKQISPVPTARIVPLKKNDLRRIAATVAVLFVISIGIYFALDNQYDTQSMATNHTPNTSQQESPTGSSLSKEMQPTDETEASDEKSLITEYQKRQEELDIIAKQEAQPKQNKDNTSKTLDADIDSKHTLAGGETLKRSAETESSQADNTILAEKSIEEKKDQTTTNAVTPPPPPIVQSAPITTDDKKEVLEDKGETEKIFDKESKQADERYRQVNKAKKKDTATEEQKPSGTVSATSGAVISSDEDLKNALKKQILDLANAQKEPLKGKFVAKVTFSKSGKIRKVTIQEMPCTTCKTDPLIKTIERHSFNSKEEEKSIEIIF
jgi:hypothetical protein